MSWLPATLPETAEHDGLRFVPLTPALVVDDYAAVMEDPDLLRRWSASDWPTDDFTVAENHADLVWHDGEQRDRIALTYSVLLDEAVRGCVYVRTFASALETRDLVLPEAANAPLDDVVVRGWLHGAPATTLVTATRQFLLGAPFEFPRLWWQTNTFCPDQIAACDVLGLVDGFEFSAGDARWVLRAAPSPGPDHP